MAWQYQAVTPWARSTRCALPSGLDSTPGGTSAARSGAPIANGAQRDERMLALDRGLPAQRHRSVAPYTAKLPCQWLPA